MKCGFCVFFGCFKYSLFQLGSTDPDTASSELCKKKQKKHWGTKKNIEMCVPMHGELKYSGSAEDV